MYTNQGLSRRRFLRQASIGAVGLSSLLPARNHGFAADGVNGDSIRLGFIGLGGRGQALLNGFISRGDCQIAALCDVRQDRLEQATQHVGNQTGTPPAALSDIHELLADRSIDAVVIATPDHWHSPAAVYACQAGKHVYVEKPVSNNVWEGRQLVEAARKYDRVVQVGTQNRSAPYNLKAREYIRSGKLGKIVLCRVYNQKVHGLVPSAPDSEPPPNFDWDRWNGPSVNTQFNEVRFSHWHDFWCYGGGDVTNCGVHQLDLAMMVLDIETLPSGVYSIGTRRPESAGETPDTVVSNFDFGKFPVTFHQTLETPYMLKTDGTIRDSDQFPLWPQNATRIEIFGSEGVMLLGRHGGGWQVFRRPKNRQPVVAAQQFGRFPDREHKEDFVQAIRDGRRPNADVLHGHRSAALCHLANISYRVGNKYLAFDVEAEKFEEKFDNLEANQLLHPAYRDPYVISAEV